MNSRPGHPSSYTVKKFKVLINTHRVITFWTSKMWHKAISIVDYRWSLSYGLTRFQKNSTTRSLWSYSVDILSYRWLDGYDWWRFNIVFDWCLKRWSQGFTKQTALSNENFSWEINNDRIWQVRLLMDNGRQILWGIQPLLSNLGFFFLNRLARQSQSTGSREVCSIPVGIMLQPSTLQYSDSHSLSAIYVILAKTGVMPVDLLFHLVTLNMHSESKLRNVGQNSWYF